MTNDLCWMTMVRITNAKIVEPCIRWWTKRKYFFRDVDVRLQTLFFVTRFDQILNDDETFFLSYKQQTAQRQHLGIFTNNSKTKNGKFKRQAWMMVIIFLNFSKLGFLFVHTFLLSIRKRISNTWSYYEPHFRN